MANGNQFRSASFINSADLFRALPNRQPESKAAQNANAMMTGGGLHQQPVKPIQAGAGAVKCASCGSFHRPGTICSNTLKAFDKLIEITKAAATTSAGKPPKVRRVPTKADDGGGNPYHDPSSGQFTSKTGGGNSGGGGTKSPFKDPAATDFTPSPNIIGSTEARNDPNLPEAATDINPASQPPKSAQVVNSNDKATGAYKDAVAKPQAERGPINANEVHERAFAGAVGRGMPKDKAMIEGTKAADEYDRAQGGGRGPLTRMMEHVNKPTNSTPTSAEKTNFTPSANAPEAVASQNGIPSQSVTAQSAPGHLDNNPNKPLSNDEWMKQHNGGAGLYGSPTSPPSTPGNGLLPGPISPSGPQSPGVIPPSVPVPPTTAKPKTTPQKPFSGNRIGATPSTASTLVSAFRSGPSIGDAFSPGATFRPTINVPGAGLHTLLKPVPQQQQAQKSLNHLNRLTKWQQNH